MYRYLGEINWNLDNIQKFKIIKILFLACIILFFIYIVTKYYI